MQKIEQEVQQEEVQENEIPQEEIQNTNTAVVSEDNNPSGNKTKIILVFSAVIVIIAVVVLAWRYWSKQESQDLVENKQSVVEEKVFIPIAEEEIVKTNSYQNSEANFQIDYPEGWVIVEDSEQKNPSDKLEKRYHLIVSSPQGVEESAGSVIVNYSIPKKNAVFTKGSLLEDLLFVFELNFSAVGTTEKIIKDGVEAHRGIESFDIGKGMVYTGIQDLFLDSNNEGVYWIIGDSSDKSGEVIYQKQVEDVISSFRFLE